MTMEMLVRTLLDANGSSCIKRVIKEASVHLPHRGRRWIASFRDQTGQQRWRSTGQTDRREALAVAQEWEKAARRAQPGQVDPMPPPRSGRSNVRQFTQKEIAILMGLSERAVREIERRALRKLKQHPAVRALWREWVGEGATSTVDLELTDAEIAAVYGLARTPDEQRALDKLMALVRA
jgi:Sigma-70, region 4